MTILSVNFAITVCNNVVFHSTVKVEIFIVDQMSVR